MNEHLKIAFFSINHLEFSFTFLDRDTLSNTLQYPPSITSARRSNVTRWKSSPCFSLKIYSLPLPCKDSDLTRNQGPRRALTLLLRSFLSSIKQRVVIICWKLYDTLIFLNLIDIYKGFGLFIHN